MTSQPDHHFLLMSLDQESALDESPSVQNEIWRQHLIQWAFAVVDSIDAPRETVFLLSHILDRFLHQQNLTDLQYFLTNAQAYQTLTSTAFLIALKLQGSFGVTLFDLVRWSHAGLSSQDIVHMGKQIVHTLNWDRPIRTPLRFAFEYIAAFFPTHVSDTTRSFCLDEVNYLLELSLLNYMISRQAPSLVALLALKVTLNTSILPQNCTDCSPTVQQHVLTLIDSSIARRTESWHIITQVYWAIKQLQYPTTIYQRKDSDPLPSNNQNDIHRHSSSINHLVPFMDSELDRFPQLHCMSGLNTTTTITTNTTNSNMYSSSAMVIPFLDDDDD